MARINSEVYFTGNASQLLATYRAVGAQAERLQRQINRVNSTSFASQGLRQTNLTARQESLLPGGVRSGPIIKNVRTEIDALNKTLRVYGDTAIRTAKYGDLITGSFEEVRGNTDQLTAATARLDKAQRVAGTARRQYLDHSSVINANRDAVIRNAQALKFREKAEKDQARAMAKSGQALRGQSGGYVTLNQKLREITNAYRLFDSNGRVASLQRFTAEINNQAKAARTALPQLQRWINLRNVMQGARADQLAAQYAAPPIPAEIQRLGRLSPTLLRDLQRSGLATDAQDLYRQNARAQIQKNLVTGTTTISGGFEKDGIFQSFNAEIDKSGKLITRFGGHLSGLQNFLNQTVRNFQKVVQWGIATTAVFGGLAFAARELSVLTELNTNLTRLGITANLSREQTDSLFDSLANIAIATATPLTEITASADDIALAVRETGKSTEDYMKDITNLTEAVGIYTNLTGTDTVQATDLLTSSMKQLGLQTEDVTGLLSKITAVAGGQSTAISDITEGLAAMAEAANNAGLSVDRTIATVQILSQVTAKSPSEIATAFKNLVGALENPAGIKQLKALNIDLISQGNNIIDIYRKIAEQVRTGEIAPTEISGVLRNLAGGPRRAPDAAALLSNIDKIAASEERAIRASNEALIANAKILDTVSAKVTQLQAKFDKIVFQKFSPAFEAGIETLVDVLTILLNIISAIPTEIIAMTIQFGVFVVALKLGISVANLMARSIGGIVGAIGAMIPALKAATAATQQLSAAQQLQAFISGGGAGGASRFKGQGKNLAVIGAGAAIGGAFGAAAGGSPISALSGILSGAGFAALQAPIPNPWLKLAGAIGIVGGGLLSLIDNGKDATKTLEDSARSAQELLQIYERYKEADLTIQGLQEQQQELRKQIGRLNDEEDKGAQNLAQLREAQNQYISNTDLMSESTLQLHEAMKAIRDINPDLARAIEGARTGSIKPEELEKEIQKLQLELLRASDPNAQLPDGPRGLFKPNIEAPLIPFQTDNANDIIAQTQKFVKGQGLVSEGLNLKELEADFSRVVELFSANGEILTATFEPTGQNIGLVTEAIKELAITNPTLAASLEKTFQAWVNQNSILDTIDTALQSYQNRIDALKFFKPEQAAELQKILDLGKKIIATAAEAGDAETAGKAAESLYQILSGQATVAEEIIPLLRTAAAQQGLLGDAALESASEMEILNQVGKDNEIILENVGFAFESTGGKVAEMTDEILAATEAMKSFVSSAQESAALESADLEAKIRRGEFKGDEEGLADAKEQVERLKSIAAAAAEANTIYQDLAATMGGELDVELQEIASEFTNINGLQDAQNLTADQLIQRLFTLADTYGLTGEQVDKLGGKLVKLLKALQTINQAKTDIKVGTSIDTSALIKLYKALNRGTMKVNPYTGFVTYSGGGQYTGLIKELEAAQNTVSNFGTSFDSVYTGGGGGGGGGSTTTRNPSGSRSGSSTQRQGYDVSTLDLPEEIANAFNRDALIKEAIRRAKALQKQIPGASKEGKNDIVELLKGTQRILEVRGVKDDLLRKALEELAEIEKKRLEFETKADTIRRIRVGAGDFAAIANVPVNSRTGVSVGGANGPINVSLNLNGTVLTPAQFQQFADLVAAAIKRQIAA